MLFSSPYRKISRTARRNKGGKKRTFLFLVQNGAGKKIISIQTKGRKSAFAQLALQVFLPKSIIEWCKKGGDRPRDPLLVEAFYA